MNPIRYSKRAVTDPAKIDALLARAPTGCLGLADGSEPYVIPLNFVWWQGYIYFHGAAEGRKNDIIRQNPRVCFTVCETYGTITDPVPASTDTAYMSVVLFGTVRQVESLPEATGALQQMLDKYVPGYYDTPLPEQHVARYRSSLDSAVGVFRITPSLITAKENPVNPARMFYPGRTRASDLS